MEYIIKHTIRHNGKKYNPGDVIDLSLDTAPRHETGRGPQHEGRAAIHVGPLLLAFDAHYNPIEVADLRLPDVAGLDLELAPTEMSRDIVHFPPMGLWRTVTHDGEPVYLCDFASAGAHGTEYAGWLPAGGK